MLSMRSNYSVSFPKLGLNFYFSPVAFEHGIFCIHWYGIIVCISFLVGIIYSFSKAKKIKVKKDSLLDVTLFSIFFSIVGARIYYILFCENFNYYLNNPIKIFAIKEGGLALYGGIIFAFLTSFVVCKIKKIEYLKVLDCASFGIFLGQAIGRWGNFFNQEAFGTKTNFLFGMCSENTTGKTVHPCFLYESIWCLLGILFLEIILRKSYTFKGKMFSLYTLIYGVGRFFIESIRTDSLLLPNTEIKISQLISIVLVIFGSTFFIFKTKNTKNKLNS